MTNRMHTCLPSSPGSLLFMLGAVLLSGCGDSGGGGKKGDGGAGPGDNSSLTLGGDNKGSGGGSGDEAEPYMLPDGFTEGRFGGYKLGAPLDGDTAELPEEDASSEGCGTTILGVVRDFREKHPDFQSYCCSLQKGLVEERLGEDQKPIYAPDGSTKSSTGKDEFNEWYNDDSEAYLLELSLEPNGGVVTFHSTDFFPLDDEGGESRGYGHESNSHNYHFTTEIHTKFVYQGGETFEFTGDDDVFVFMNGQLVIDLGGVHGAENASVELDDVAGELGLELGKTYDLDLFHAERRTSESNFRIDTTLSLVDCGYVVPTVK